MKFCLDANVFITAWNTHYPYPVFPSLWQQLVKHKTEFILLKCIYGEIGIEELQKFIDNHKVEKQDIDPSVKKIALQFGEKYDIQETGIGISKIDAELIAYAKYHRLTVITYEGIQKDRPTKISNYKIPLVCEIESVRCDTLKNMLLAMNIKI